MDSISVLTKYPYEDYDVDRERDKLYTEENENEITSEEMDTMNGLR